MQKKHIIGFFIMAATIVTATFFCCNTDKDSQQKDMMENKANAADSLAFKVGILPTTDSEIVVYADKHGIFDSLGVDVKLLKYKSLSECRYAMKHKLVDGVTVDSIMAEVISRKDSVDIVYGPTTPLSWKIISSKKARIHRKSQLADKIIAADSQGYSRHFAEECIDSLLKKGKLAFVIQVEDVSVRYDMLRMGNVDAAVLPEPYASVAVSNGHKLLIDDPKHTNGVFVFRKEITKDKRRAKQYKLFLEALDIAKNYMRR